MSDQRLSNFSKILTYHSANIQAGDRVLIEATTEAEPLVRQLTTEIIKAGGHPHLLLSLPDEEEILFQYGNTEQIQYIHQLRYYAYQEFESRIRIHSLANTRALSNVPASKQGLRQKALASILATQMERGAKNEFKWVTTLFPTQAYAMEANMGIHEYADFVYQAVHADDPSSDPLSYWNTIKEKQSRIITLIEGHDVVTIRGEYVDLRLSIKGRKFNNSYGRHNMPDGEIYTGPVEDSIDGWVRFSFPAITQGRVVEGVELKFSEGKVVSATSKTNQEFLLQMLDTDAGSRYVGEFAIGTNYNIDRFTGNILFDEKIGGTFHMALGAGYPETGSQNRSMIHWDMICDLRENSEIRLDGELIYKDGQFTI